jgi:predicted phosphoribosyltransferase
VADRVICPLAPPDFYAVGAWYESFGQVSDAEVMVALGLAD